MSSSFLPPDLCPTGVSGLDRILGGGLPAGRSHIIQGQPGTGKTTLALQFAIEGARRGERVLYVALSESEGELRSVAASHGWDLSGVVLHEVSAQMAAEHLGGDQTIFESEEVELDDVAGTILQRAREVRPGRIVIDSLSDLRVLANSPLRYRRQLYTLKHLFGELDATVLLTAINTSRSDVEVEDLVHGVIEMEQASVHYGSVRRSLQVIKMRGMGFLSGVHDMRILKGGVQVFPRLSGMDNGTSNDWTQIKSGLPNLDELLGGGLETGTACLITGPSGTGKTTLGSLYVHTAAATRGHSSSIYLFDERVETLHRRAEGLGIPIAKYEKTGLIRIVQLNAGETSPGEFSEMVRQDVEERGVKIVMIDSLTGYAFSMLQERLLAVHVHELINYLSSNGILSLMVSTRHGLLLGEGGEGVELTYLADTVIICRHFEAAGAVRQAVSVVKKRHGSHERTIRELSITTAGVNISAPITAFDGVLTGHPRFEGEDSHLIDRRTVPTKDEHTDNGGGA